MKMQKFNRIRTSCLQFVTCSKVRSKLILSTLICFLNKTHIFAVEICNIKS